MHSRDLDPSPSTPWSYPDLVLRTPPNWTVVGFLVLLAALHLSAGGRALLAGRWEGCVSLVFGTMFAIAAVVAFHVRREVAVLYGHGRLRLRTGAGRWCAERFVPFGRVHAVRVTLGPRGSARDSLVELICRHDDVPCPPTAVPRQLGLLLALMTGAPLVRVSAEPQPARAAGASGTMFSRIVGAFLSRPPPARAAGAPETAATPAARPGGSAAG